MLSDFAHLVETTRMALPPSLRFMVAILSILVAVLWLWPRHSVRRRGWQRRSTWRTPRHPQILLEESPIEEIFRQTWSQAHPHMLLQPQYPIGPYRVDFAHLASQVVIELDGFVAHSSTLQIEDDCRRQREIMRRGWQVFRFGGREVHHDPQRCVQETYAFILQQQQAHASADRSKIIHMKMLRR